MRVKYIYLSRGHGGASPIQQQEMRLMFPTGQPQTKADAYHHRERAPLRQDSHIVDVVCVRAGLWGETDIRHGLLRDTLAAGSPGQSESKPQAGARDFYTQGGSTSRRTESPSKP